MRRASTRRGKPESALADLVTDFACAYRPGGEATLARMLDDGIRLVVDSGGTVPEATEPVRGRVTALRMLRRALGDPTALELAARSVNGRPGLIGRRDGRVVAVIALDGSRGRVREAWVVTNPDKLTAWDPPK